MKRIIAAFGLSLAAGAIIAALVAFLEVRGLISLVSDLNEVLLMVGCLFFVLALLSLTNSSETGKGLQYFSTTIRYGMTDEGPKDRAKFGFFSLFLATGAFFLGLSFLLPRISL
jgi:hypothetical protein